VSNLNSQLVRVGGFGNSTLLLYVGGQVIANVLSQLLRRVRSAASQPDEQGGNQQTRGNRGCEHQSQPKRMVFSPQVEQLPHANGAVRCMINSWVSKCYPLGFLG